MHIPILLKEVVDNLNLKRGSVVVDATTNRAGHSLELAKKIGKEGTLICIDLDEGALKEAKKLLEDKLKESERPIIFYINDNFRNLEKILKDLNIKNIDGLVADLGVSSEEIDDSGRGFTFQKDEPLLMTLTDKVKKHTLTAEKILNTWGEESLADIIYYYGDEKYARKIAKNICLTRQDKPIKSTFQLVAIIEKSLPREKKRGKIHFATKTFQAIRIAVNDELSSIEQLVHSLKNVLEKGGKASFLTFHSGEDRILKRSVKSEKDNLKLLKFFNKKDFLEPSREEIKLNSRSRSAKLRLVEKYN